MFEKLKYRMPIDQPILAGIIFELIDALKWKPIKPPLSPDPNPLRTT